MAKDRKTKRQKLLSDRRHFEKPTPPTSGESYSLETITQAQPPPQQSFQSSSQAVISVSDYKYLRTDMRKIAIVTGIIILSELGISWTSVGF